MKIFKSYKLSDADFVEKTRKKLSLARRIAWKCLAFSALYLALIPFICYFARKEDFYGTGFSSGCAVGIFIGVSLTNAIVYFSFFTTHLFGNRIEKLLVTYYDQVHSLNK
jgi:hypothetical protein